MRSAGRILTVITTVAFLTVLSGIFSWVGATESDLRDQLDDIGKQIEQTESDLKEKQQQQSKAESELRYINNLLKTTEKKLRTTEQNLAKTEKELEVLESELAKSQDSLNANTNYLKERLNIIYEQGDIQILDVLFNSASISDFLTRWDYFSCLAENDATVIDKIKDEIKNLEEKQKLVLIKKETLLSLQKDQSNQRQEMALASSRQQEIYKSIQSDVALLEDALKELEEESNRIAAELSRLAGGDSAYLGTGKMAWPTPGYTRITSPYGMRRHPITRKNSMHTGMDIAAPRGYKIVAAEKGTVIETASRGAYGNVVMINHGGGIVTLYAHTSKYLVKPGQYVNKGAAIALIGTTGWSTGPHLHFEVREKGNPVNPINYLK